MLSRNFMQAADWLVPTCDDMTHKTVNLNHYLPMHA